MVTNIYEEFFNNFSFFFYDKENSIKDKLADRYANTDTG